MGLIFGKEKTKPVKKQEERVDENDDDGRSRILKGDFSKIPENPANEIRIFLSSTFSGVNENEKVIFIYFQKRFSIKLSCPKDN